MPPGGMGEGSMDIVNTDKLFIGSRWASPATAELADAVAPYDASVITRLPRPSIEDARLAVELATEAFDGWSALSVTERLAYVSRFCASLNKRLDQIAEVWALESGMPITQCRGFSSTGSELWNLLLKDAESAPWTEIRDTIMGRVEIRHEADGPTVGIVTFNGPHLQFALAILPAVIAGTR
jgi:acyl-CoA reductase-like NAD-dependent aldehyde dehydrogenase